MSASVWKKCRLDQVSDINPQTGAIPNEFVYVDLESVVAGELLSVNFLSKKDAPSRAQRNLSSGDILYQTVRPYQRNNYFFEGDKKKYVASTGYAQIKAKEFNKYLYHYLHTDDFISDVLSRCTGTSYPAIAPKELSRVLVYLPLNREEQKHISDILSTCDTVIQNTQKTIDKYKAIKQGMMQDLFTRGLTKDGKLRPSYKEAPELYKESELGMIPKEWEVKELKVLCNSIGDGLHGTPSYESNTELYFINGNNLDNGVINLSNAEEISEISYQKNKIDLSEKTLFLSINGTIGNVAFYNGEQILLGKSAAYINTRDINKYFLMYYIQTDYFSRYINKVLTGSTIQNLSLDSIRKMPVIDCEEQSEIAKRLSSIDSTIKKEEAVLEKYKNIKTGLMARLLTSPEDAEIIDETGE